MNVELLEPDRERLWSELHDLARLCEPDSEGWTRRVFSEPYRAARDWVRGRMRDAGLSVTTDPAGNIVGRLPGRHGGAPLVTGSHTDTVEGGGRFDGVVGVLGAIEVVRRLRETGTRLDHDLLVVDFLGEEVNPYSGSCLGSQAATGVLTADDLDRTGVDGKRLGDVATAFGLDPNGLLAPTWATEPLHGYLELHIEQGPMLERRGMDIGVVTAIVGIERFLATFIGRADHAGTRRMGDRRDALVAAAKSVLAVEREGCAGPESAVATCGALRIEPGAENVVPGRTLLAAEFRSEDQTWLSGVRRRVVDEIARLSAENGVEALIEWSADNPVVPTNPSVQNLTAGAADELGLSWEAMPSGAGHDAAHLAARCPAGMIFVPSRDGRSHCPDEWTDAAQVATGVHLLAASLLRMDQQATVDNEFGGVG
ncbi:M20 family metallo-hydrolase [Saccharopolyspora sp. K220]|uniref:M20 family metallo-hydrolase n=1 Tax=Saccharopolyspora soli TaxID=2926618 RepID=UPI001F58085F|nr:M20 family metallo-hydrolase [Saccharopolyspora soli]MCI2417350.1 M20 family metallo-hydrolase [Saccharopolyspora soli]